MSTSILIFLVAGGVGALIVFIVHYLWPNRANFVEYLKKSWHGEEKIKTVIKKGKQKPVTDDNGNPVKETVKKGKKDVLKERGSKIAFNVFFMVFGSLLVIILFEQILGRVGSSIVVVFIATLIASIGKRKIVGKGLIFGLFLGMVNFFIPASIVGTITLAAWLVFMFGWITFILEELTENQKNIFPWYILYLCLGGAVINIFQAALDGSAGHHVYVLQVLHQHTDWMVIRWFTDLFPPSSHVFGEVSRVWLITKQLAQAIQWLFAGVIIFLISAPGEIKGWLEQVQIWESIKNFFYSILGLLMYRKR
jgi:hypothetical protein